MIWSKVRLTPTDKALVAAAEAEAQEQREEALNLLAATRKVSAVLRESRNANHYRESLDEVLGGRTRRRKSGT